MARIRELTGEISIETVEPESRWMGMFPRLGRRKEPLVRKVFTINKHTEGPFTFSDLANVGMPSPRRTIVIRTRDEKGKEKVHTYHEVEPGIFGPNSSTQIVSGELRFDNYAFLQVLEIPNVLPQPYRAEDDRLSTTGSSMRSRTIRLGRIQEIAICSAPYYRRDVNPNAAAN